MHNAAHEQKRLAITPCFCGMSHIPAR